MRSVRVTTLRPAKLLASGRSILGLTFKAVSPETERKWAAKTKPLIAPEGFKGSSVDEMCTEHQISQSPDDQWHDRFLAHAAPSL